MTPREAEQTVREVWPDAYSRKNIYEDSVRTIACWTIYTPQPGSEKDCVMLLSGGWSPTEDVAWIDAASRLPQPLAPLEEEKERHVYSDAHWPLVMENEAPAPEPTCGAVVGKQSLRPDAVCVRSKGHTNYHGTDEDVMTSEDGFFWHDSESTNPNPPEPRVWTQEERMDAEVAIAERMGGLESRFSPDRIELQDYDATVAIDLQCELTELKKRGM